MIKFIQCVKRKPEMSVADFRQYWQQYRDRFRAVAEAVGSVRCSESMTLTVERNLEIMLSRGTSEPFDAVAEIWVTSAADVGQALDSEATQNLLDELQRLQSEFMDLGRSSFFFTSEEVMIGGD
jgi:hypothetical protein